MSAPSVLLRATHPLALLHIEGGVALALALALYERSGGSWLLFALLLLVPDLSALGYLAGSATGAFCYNVIHTYVGPAVLGGVGLAIGQPLAALLALIWVAHIGMDRLLGFGLKYPDGFRHTHLTSAHSSSRSAAEQ